MRPDRELERSIATDSLRYFVGKLGVAAAGILLVPLTVRLLGESGYGTYALAFSIALLVSQVWSGWLQQAILRFGFEASQGPENQVFVGTIRWIAVSVAVGAGVTATCVVLTRPSSTIAIGISSGALAASLSSARLATALASSQLFVTRSAIADTVRVAIPTGLTFLLLMRFGQGSLDASAGVLLAAVGAGLAAIAAVWASRDLVGLLPSHFSGSLARGLARYGAPMGMWMALAAVFPVVTRGYVGAVGNAAELGVFAAYQDVAIKIGTLALMPVTRAAHGRIMAGAGTRQRTNTGLAASVKIAGPLAIATILGAWFGAPYLSGILGLDPTGPYLVVLLVLGEVIAQLGMLAHKGMELRGATVGATALMLLSLGVLMLCLMVGTQVGGLGASTVAVISIVVARLAYLFGASIASTRLLRRPSIEAL